MNFLLLLSVFSLTGIEAVDPTLEKLLIVFRPGSTVPPDKKLNNDNCKISNMTGHLSDIGIHQSQMLGVNWRLWYDDILGKTPNVIVYYSKADGCQESAGLAINAAFSIYNNTVIKISEMTDEGENWPPDFSNEDLIKKMDSSYKVKDGASLANLADYMLYEIAENGSSGCIPPWLNNLKQDLLDFNNAYYSYYQRCASANVVRNNTDDITSAIFNQLNPKNSAANPIPSTIYALPQEAMAALLSRMTNYDVGAIPTAAAFYFELHGMTDKYIVRVFYDNSTDHRNRTQLSIRSCDMDCPYDKFVELTSNVTECDSKSSSTHQQTSFLFVFLLLFGGWFAAS